YFGPYYLFETNIKGWRFPAILVGFIVNYAAYFAEIYRGGIESMPVGQYEAAKVLGYTKSQTFMRIILPQVVKRILPSITNEMITLVKDTSMAFTLAYQEVFSLAKQISASQTSFMPFLIAGVFYFVANYVVAYAMERVEKSMQYYR
ncbi:MAG: ABC transporter permease subunit, partial [Clostridia bacterium]|nr:ABC transporter permease subunit [Clostridia bacterium]